MHWRKKRGRKCRIDWKDIQSWSNASGAVFYDYSVLIKIYDIKEEKKMKIIIKQHGWMNGNFTRFWTPGHTRVSFFLSFFFALLRFTATHATHSPDNTEQHPFPWHNSALICPSRFPTSLISLLHIWPLAFFPFFLSLFFFNITTNTMRMQMMRKKKRKNRISASVFRSQ